MQNISNKIPHLWSYDFLNNLQIHKRPNWEIENPDPEDLLSYCIESGASKKNKKGWGWGFLNDFEYENQGYDKNLDFGIKYNKWWISKVEPGCMMPVHTDNHGINNQIRYWIPLQDWILGHIFFLSDGNIIKYKKGDVHKFDETTFHGASNNSKISKFSLQLLIEPE